MKAWFSSRRAGAWLPALVMLAGAAAAAAGAGWLQARARADAEADFGRMLQRTSAEITDRFRKPVYGLNGARGLYAAQPEVSRDSFRAYVDSRSLPVEFPGVRGFGFIQPVPRDTLAAFVAAERADGAPQFALRQLEKKDLPELFVIKQIEPAERNAGAMGLDVGSEAVRRQGVQWALESGEPTLTGVITLVQDKRHSPGMLLYLPVFQSPAAGVAPSGNRGTLRGLLYAPIVLAELLEGLGDAVAGQVQVELFDTASGTLDGPLMYASHGAAPGASAGSAPSSQARQARHEATHLLTLPGRLVTMQLRSTAAFEALHTSRTPAMFFLGTLTASALLAALLRQLALGTRRAEVRAEQMTVDLNRLALVARRTTNAVVITDVQRRITWANAGFERLTGYAIAEVLGRSPGSLLQSETTDAATVQRLREALDAEEGFTGELLNRGKNGQPYWLSVEIQPLRDDRGVLTGFMAIEQNITERKQAEAALRASEAFLDRTGRIGGVGGWALDATTLRVDWTDQTCRIHDLPPGHRPAPDEALGYYAPEARHAIETAVRRSLADGLGFDLELPLITATGRPIWVRAVGEAERQSGQAVRLVGALQDITARREMADQIRRSNALLRSVLDSLPCGLSVFDGELQLTVCNAEFARLLEMPEHLCAAGATHFEDLIRFNAARGEYGSGDVEATIQAIVARARQPATPHQFERTRPNGTVLEIRGAPLAGGGFVTTYTDASARHHAEAQAQRNSQLLRGAIEAIDEAFVLYDPDDRLVLCNDRYRMIYAGMADLFVPGARFEDIVRVGAMRGDYVAARGRVDDWVAERVAAHQKADSTIVQKLDTGKTLRIIERKLPDGHIVGFRIDITELVSATEAAQQASMAKSQFLANMSHEIRTPMNAILGMLALLQKTALTPRQADYAAKTEGAARSLLGLLNDILDFSKVEAGKMTLDPQPFRTDQLLRDLAVILSASLGSKPVELLFDIDPALPRQLLGDALRLQQVLINLGGNAIKFTAEGEVAVQVKVLARTEQAATLRVSVRDTGIGIAPENQARIFSGFTQAEASTTRRFGGTGLGVAISQRLVGLMGGELQLDSTPGFGSCFHFEITLALTASGDDVAPPRALRALVVDDHATAREVLVRMGAGLGWAMDTASSGQQALDLLQSQHERGVRYDAVFLDWQMPGLDGWDTARLIDERGLGGEAQVVVMVTAHGREMLAQRSAAEQDLLDGFLVKPVTASMLLDAVIDARRGVQPPLPHLSQRTAAQPGQRLAGLRLLVAEDNANNQQVARELLEDEGALVQIAGDGQAAVQAVEAADPAFDLVLMDLQMPVMDGFTATRRIRRDLALPGLPIVAMTANAMASDRDACLAAGMNDHVGKPFDLDHLVGVLRRLTGRDNFTATATATITAPRTADPASPPLPAGVAEQAQAAGVDIAGALARLGGKRPVYERLLHNFTHDLAALPTQLRAHAGDGDAVAAARALHTLKGLAATLGATALAALATEGEQALARASVADLPKACEPACLGIEQARPALAALHQALQATASPGADSDAAGAHATRAEHTPPPASAWLELASLLENSDMRATDLMAQMQQRHGHHLGPAWPALDDAVAALDFERALQLCQPMLTESTT